MKIHEDGDLNAFAFDKSDPANRQQVYRKCRIKASDRVNRLFGKQFKEWLAESDVEGDAYMLEKEVEVTALPYKYGEKIRKISLPAGTVLKVMGGGEGKTILWYHGLWENNVDSLAVSRQDFIKISLSSVRTKWEGGTKLRESNK